MKLKSFFHNNHKKNKVVFIKVFDFKLLEKTHALRQAIFASY